MSWFRKNLSTIFMFFALFAGLGLLLYPTFLKKARERLPKSRETAVRFMQAAKI